MGQVDDGKRYILEIEIPDRGFAWATHDGIEGYHYTLVKNAAKVLKNTEMVAMLMRMDKGCKYRIIQMEPAIIPGDWTTKR